MFSIHSNVRLSQEACSPRSVSDFESSGKVKRMKYTGTAKMIGKAPWTLLVLGLAGDC